MNPFFGAKNIKGGVWLTFKSEIKDMEMHIYLFIVIIWENKRGLFPCNYHKY